jgi:transcriptional regulator with XRE-family HTH domain
LSVVVEDSEERVDRVAVPTIKELILTQRESLGLSYREMSQRADRAGLKIKHQTIQELATARPKQWPKTSATIRALAEALDVTERAVVLAFARSFDLEVSADSSLLEMILPAGTKNVHPSIQQAIAGVVRAAISAQHEEGPDREADMPTMSGKSKSLTQEELGLAARKGRRQPTAADVLDTFGEESQDTDT